MSSSRKMRSELAMARLQDVVLLRQVRERLVEALGVLEEGDQRADRDRAARSPGRRRTQISRPMPIAVISSTPGKKTA